MRALDINDTLLELLRGRVADSGLTNIEVAKVERDDPRLAPGGVDTILMVDTLHYVKDRPAYARKLAAGLAPGGRVVIIDFLPKPIEERPWGPPPEQKMPREEVDAAMAAAGLVPRPCTTSSPSSSSSSTRPRLLPEQTGQARHTCGVPVPDFWRVFSGGVVQGIQDPDPSQRPPRQVAPAGSLAVQVSEVSLHDSLQSASPSGPGQGSSAWTAQAPAPLH